ncbi:MAG: UDP-N-acetylglucosamine 1-carboxyvinyltransferase, partial [Candidatus Fermentibacterota bacterium]
MSRVPPDSYLVQGGRRLKGTLHPAGSKNAALPELAASLLSDRPVTIRNLPMIRDVQAMLEILRSLGASVERQDGQSVRITARNIDTSGLDMELCRRIRASILLAGPLLARCGSLRLPPPGGDVIGRRRLDTHFMALKRMGAGVDFDGTAIALEAEGLQGVSMLLDEPSV